MTRLPHDEQADINFVTDRSSLERSAYGQVSGRIHARIGESAFPEQHWSDSVVTLLTWWLEVVLNLLSREKSSVRLRFMDGPFWMDVLPRSEALWAVQCRNGTQGRVMHESFVAPEAMARALLNVATTILEECAARGWDSREISRLAELRGRLEAMVAS